MKLNVEVPQWPTTKPGTTADSQDTTYMNVPPKAPLYAPEEPAYRAQQDLSMKRKPNLESQLLLIANTNQTTGEEV